MNEIPAPPTRERLEKLIALANDGRGDPNVRRVAKRKLALYAKHFPNLVRVKNDHRQDR